MAVRLGGINTGLPPNIVQQLVEAERVPITTMENKKSQVEYRLKLLGDLTDKVSSIRGGMGELANIRGFSDINVETGDPEVLVGTANPEIARPGNWSLEVTKLAQKASAITNGFPDKDRTQIGVGYFSFKTPEGEKEVYINKKNSTLDRVARAINTAEIGMRAMIVNDQKDKENPFRLVISGDTVGDESHIQYPTLYLLDGDRDFYFDKTRAASNGQIKIDGFEVEIGDNKIDDLIDGVTLDLKKAEPGKEVFVSVKEDFEAVVGKTETFVTSINEVLKFLQEQSNKDENTDPSKLLNGGLIRSLQSGLRQFLQAPIPGVDGNVKRLSQIGIEFNRYGTLDFNKEKFNAILNSRPYDVRGFLAGNGISKGFIPALRRKIKSLTAPDFGPLTNRKRNLESKIKRLNNQIENKERRIAKKEVALRRKFSRLEETMSRLKSQGGALAGMGGGGGNSLNLSNQA